MLEGIIQWLTHPVTWIGILVIGMGGEVSKNLALGTPAERKDKDFKGWRRVYAITFRGHALFVGTLVGLLTAVLPEMPSPEWVAGSFGGHVAYWIGNGALSMVLYASVVATLRALFRQMKPGPKAD
jgi:hypothetical protein